MFKTIWKYRVLPEKADEFRTAYGSAGIWAGLFGKQEGYLGTRLFLDLDDPNLFLTIDSWKDEASFKAFKKKFGLEYEDLDASLEHLTTDETHIGMIKD